MKQRSSKFPLVIKPSFIEPVGLGEGLNTVPEKSFRRGPAHKHKHYTLPQRIHEGCQSSRLAEYKKIKRMVWKTTINVKRYSELEIIKKCRKRVAISIKEWTGGHSFTSGVSSINNKHVG